MTMTKLPTDVAFDLLVVEQLHDIVPCDSHLHSRTARWTITCNGCGLVSFACNPCRDFYDNDRGEDDVYCTKCQATWPAPTPWVAL